MQEQAGSYECLQCQYLVKTFRVFSFIEKVVSDAEVDTEDRHGQFGAYRNAYGKLFAERRAVEFFFVYCVICSGKVVFQIGAFIVLGIQRKSGAEILVYPVERIEV